MKHKLKFKEIDKIDEKGKVIERKFFINDKEQTEQTFNVLYADDSINIGDEESPKKIAPKLHRFPQNDFDSMVFNLIDKIRNCDDDDALELIKENLSENAVRNYINGQSDALVEIRKTISDQIMDLNDELDDIDGIGEGE